MKLFGGKANARTEKIMAFFQSMSRKHKIVIATCLVVVAAIITVVALAVNSIKSPVPMQVDEPKAKQVMESEVIPDGDEIEVEGKSHKEDFITVLIVGADDGGWNTDTIMLAAFDVSANKLNVLSIPRDTIVNVKRSNKKINAAFSSGGRARNVDELKEEVKSVTGIMPDKYAIVELDGFIEMIDAIGGVTVDVPIDMVYNDPAQDLTINIKKGLRTLDGYDSMGFMRYRKTYVEGDVGRIKVQQTFIKALTDKMLKPATLTKVPKLAQIVMDNVDTDLTLGNIIWLGKEAVKMDPSADIQTFLMPGEGSYYQKLSYFFPYKAQVIDLINEHFNPYVNDIKNINIFDPRGQEQEKAASAETKVESEVAVEEQVPVVQAPEQEEPIAQETTEQDVEESEESVQTQPEVEIEPETIAPDAEVEQIPDEEEQSAESDEPANEPEVVPTPSEDAPQPDVEQIISEDFYEN